MPDEIGQLLETIKNARTTIPFAVAESPETTPPGFLEKVFLNLDRLGGSVRAASVSLAHNEPVSKIAASAFEGFKKPWLTTGRDVAREYGLPTEGWAGAFTGFGVNVLTDPLTYLGGVLGRTAFKGVTLAGGQVRQAIRSVPILDAGFVEMSKKLIPHYGVPRDFVDTLLRTQGRTRALTAEESDLWINWAKRYRSLDPGQRSIFTDVLEKVVPNPEWRTTHETLQLATEMRTYGKRLLEREQTAGIPIKELADEGLSYLPHWVTPEARIALDKAFPLQFRGASSAWRFTHGGALARLIRGKTINQVNAEIRQGVSLSFGRGPAALLKVDKFFEDDPIMLWSMRATEGFRAIAARELFHETAHNFGKVAAELTPAAEASLKAAGFDLAKFDRLPAGPIQAGKWARSAGMERLFGVGGKHLWFDPAIVNELDKLVSRYDPSELNKFLRFMDAGVNWWKAWTLMPIPAYHVRNMISNYFNNWLGGVNNPTAYTKAAKLMWGDRSVKVGRYGFDDLNRLSWEYGIRGKAFSGTDIAIRRKLGENPSLMTLGTNNILIRAGGFVGENIEDHARIAHFLDKLNKGWSPKEAAMSVRKYLFEYDELTDFERTVLRRFIPFYTWSRKNIPLQAESLLTQPHKIINFKRLADVPGQAQFQQVPDHTVMPKWLWDVSPVPVFRFENGRFAVTLLDNVIPTADLNVILRPGSSLLQSVNPLLASPAQWITNFSVLTGRPIERYPGEKINFMGLYLPRKLAFMLRNFRLLSEMDKLNPGSVWGTKDTPGIFGVKRDQAVETPQLARFFNAVAGVRLVIVDPDQGRAIDLAAAKKIFKQSRSRAARLMLVGDPQHTAEAERLLRNAQQVFQETAAGRPEALEAFRAP